MSSNTFFQTAVLAAFVAHVMAIIAVWYSPWGSNGLLLLNGLVALVALSYAATRVRHIFSPTDWSYLMLIIFELAVITAAVLACRGNRPALIGSYAVFALHLCGTLAAVFLAFVFRITRLI